MPPKPTARAKGKPAPAAAKNKNAPMTKAELRAALKEEAKNEAVIDQELLRVSYKIGRTATETSTKSNEVNDYQDQVETALGQSTNSITHATSLHFAAQKENETRLDRLRERIANLEAQLRDAEEELEQIKAEKKKVLEEKDSVIKSQTDEMKEMSFQFSDMLMKTLITITEDFDTQNNDYDHEHTQNPF